MAREWVNERSAAWLYLYPYDTTGLPLVPTTISFTVHDIYSGQELLPETPATPGQEIELAVPPVINAMVDTTNATELRRVTWRINAAQANEFAGDYIYEVRNLVRVT